MSRSTWRDVVVDVFAISVLFAAVLMRVWEMSSAAPWMVAIVAGRWGASSMAKLALARIAGAPPSNRTLQALGQSSPPPPGSAGDAPPVVMGARTPEPAEASEEEKKPLPSSAIVLLLVAIASLAWKAWTKMHHV